MYSKFVHSILYNNLFQCLRYKKAFREAEEVFGKLLSIDPKFFTYYEYLAKFYIDINKLDKAMDTLIKGIEVDNTYFKFYYLMGNVAYLRKNYLEAIQQFNQSYMLNPLDLPSLCYLTTINNLIGKYQESAALLKQFDIKLHNNTVGELLFNNTIIALLNTKTDISALQVLVDNARTIRPRSALIQRIQEKLRCSPC